MAVLTTALAAEAYANDYLWFHFFARNERLYEKLEQWGLVDKYCVLPILVGGQPLFEDGRDPLNALIELERARNTLAHPKASGEDDRRRHVRDAALPARYAE